MEALVMKVRPIPSPTASDPGTDFDLRRRCEGPSDGAALQDAVLTHRALGRGGVPCQVQAQLPLAPDRHHDLPTPVGYVDVRGACRYTSLSRRTLDYAKDAGELPFCRRGRKILFSVQDLATWVERGRVDVTGDLDRMEKSGIIPTSRRVQHRRGRSQHRHGADL